VDVGGTDGDADAEAVPADAGDCTLAAVQAGQSKGQEKAPAEAEPAVTSPPARTRVVREAAMCVFFFRIRRPYLLPLPPFTSRDATHCGHAGPGAGRVPGGYFLLNIRPRFAMRTPPNSGTAWRHR